jgi:hypothetical protein
MATHLIRRASEETEGEDAAVSSHKFFFLCSCIQCMQTDLVVGSSFFVSCFFPVVLERSSSSYQLKLSGH